jgi:multidrug resistance efflux pump
MTRTMTNRLLILEERVVTNEARVAEARSDMKRIKALHADGKASRQSLEEAALELRIAEGDRATDELEREQIRAHLEALKSEVFDTDAVDGPLQAQRAILDLEILALQREDELRKNEARKAAVGAELEAALEALKDRSDATIVVTPGMHIWRVNVRPGMNVSVGHELLSYVDCKELLVDIAVDDATLELIDTGQPVRLRVFGRPQEVVAKVLLVRGSGGVAEGTRLAAAVRDRALRDGQVLARIEGGALGDAPGRTCDIGRTSYAEFEGIGFFEAVIGPLFH